MRPANGRWIETGNVSAVGGAGCRMCFQPEGLAVDGVHPDLCAGVRHDVQAGLAVETPGIVIQRGLGTGRSSPRCTG